MVTFLVREYDEAKRYFIDSLDFTLIEDTIINSTKRWLVVGSPRGKCTLLLAKATTQLQRDRIGSQAGDRVAFFLHTEDIERDYAKMRSRGIRFLEEPRIEHYGTVVQFSDLYGNKWDLIQPVTKQ